MITDKNYKDEIKKYEHLIGEVLKPENLPLIYVVASDWSTHGETQQKWLMQKHGNIHDKTFLTKDELKTQIEILDNFKWHNQLIEIMMVFRNENNGQVYFYTAITV